jgi:hypothetical protein
MDDSVLIDTSEKNEQPCTIKNVLVLYAIFLFIVSDVFINSILNKFEGGVRERNPTNLGILIQGIFLVIFYILSMYLIKYDVL